MPHARSDTSPAPTRREFLASVGLVAGSLALATGGSAAPAARRRVPVIDTTDLYHPYQDPGDNVDLIAAYALPEVDLRAVVLDVTERFRDPATEGIAREPGFIPVQQLNRVFGRGVPYGVAPSRPLRSPDDPALDAPADQQAGVRLLLETLDRSPEPVDVTVFGSARAVAIGLNREPALLQRKVRLVHLCAGSSDPSFVEWNVALDPHAMARLLGSRLPLAVYPCGTADGAFAYGPHNGYWRLPDLQFVRRMHPRLRSYLAYAFSRSSRIDFLRAVEEDVPEEALAGFVSNPHSVWETCVWATIAGRALASRGGGPFRLVPQGEVAPGDTVLPNDLVPVHIRVSPDGTFTWRRTKGHTNVFLYDRGDPLRNEAALREAFPALYTSFAPGA
jgi:pyrimidine-specific ribonucleoside hydrolase